MKILAIVNAIMKTGNDIRASLVGANPSGEDQLTKTMDALKSALMPHKSEDVELKAQKIKEQLEEESAKGIRKFKVVGKNKNQSGRLKRGPQRED